MRLSLIGPGNIEFHYYELLGIPKSKFESELEKIASALAESKCEIELLPDKGISLEIAKIYKKKNGKRIIGTVPKNDKTFGIKHLEPYINEKVDGKPLFDEIVDTENWYKHDLIKGLLGNAILYLGASPGTNGELNYAVYLYKLLKGRKQGVNIAGKFIHPEIRAGDNFSVSVYSPFLKNGKLNKEDEAYMKKFGIRLFYVKNAKELKEKLKRFS